MVKKHFNGGHQKKIGTLKRLKKESRLFYTLRDAVQFKTYIFFMNDKITLFLIITF